MRSRFNFLDRALAPRHLAFWTLLASITTVIGLIVTIGLATSDRPGKSAGDGVADEGSPRPTAMSSAGRPSTSPAPSPSAARASDDPDLDYHAPFGGSARDKWCSDPIAPEASVGGLTITAPMHGDTIGTPTGRSEAEEMVKGTIDSVPGDNLWIFLYTKDTCFFYFMQRGPMTVTVGPWAKLITPLASENGTYMLYVVVVDADDNARMIGALAKGIARHLGASDLYLYRLPSGGRAAHITVICCK